MSEIEERDDVINESLVEDDEIVDDELNTHSKMNIFASLKTAKTGIIVGCIAAAVVVLLSVFVFDPFHLNLSLFGNKLEIEKTKNVVTEIKKISEFTTACFYEEIVLQDMKYKVNERPVYKKVKTGSAIKDALHLGKEQDGIIRDSTMTAQVALIVHGKVRAGYDFSQLLPEDLVVSGDTLSIKIPEVKIFDVIVNPSDLEMFHRTGSWTDDDISAVVGKAKDEIEKDAIENGLLEKAATFGKEKIVLLFKAFGFEVVKLQ